MAVALVSRSTDFWAETTYRFPGSEGSCEDEGRIVMAEGGSLDLRWMHQSERARVYPPLIDLDRHHHCDVLRTSHPPFSSLPTIATVQFYGSTGFASTRRIDVRRAKSCSRIWENGTGTMRKQEVCTWEQHLYHGRGRRRRTGGA